MPIDPLYGEIEILTPAEQQAKGVLPPGPLVPRSPSGPAPDVSMGTGFEQVEPGTVGIARQHPLIEQNLPALVGMASGPFGPLTAGAMRFGMSGSPGAALGEAASFYLGGKAGKLLGKGAGYLTKTKAYERYASRIEGHWVDLLKRNDPAWKDLSSLTQMFQGQDALSADFDKSLRAAIKQAEGKTIPLPLQAVEELGLTPLSIPLTSTAQQVLGRPQLQLVPVDAVELVKTLPGTWKKFPAAYRQGVAALDAADLGDPAARMAYKWGSGAIDYLDKTKALIGEKLNPEKAMAGLVDKKSWNMLRQRGMQEFAQVLRGAEPSPVVKEAASPLKHTAARFGGLVGGTMVGHPFLGAHAAGQAVTGGFRGVPDLPAVQAIKQLAPRVGGPLGSALFGATQAQAGPLVEHRQRIEQTQKETAPPAPVAPKETDEAREKRLMEHIQSGKSPLPPEDFKWLQERLK